MDWPKAGGLVELQQKLSSPATVGFLDLGTNSIRLLLVRVNPNLSYTELTRQKEVVRLGEDEFLNQTLQPEAMRRAAHITRQFAELARSRQAQEVVAVATSATREAANQAEFIQLVKAESGLDLRVVSGREEARLIYLGVSSGIHLGENNALFIDIGGGSTETILGNQHRYEYLETHKLGAIRLASLFFLPDERGPVDEVRYAVIKNYVRNAIVRTVQNLRAYPVDLVYGSSGTITNLAEVAYRYIYGREYERGAAITRQALSETIRMLCRLPLAARREAPGINAFRADIIIPGGAILETFLEELNLTDFRTSERGLLEGMLVDYLARHDASHELDALSVRELSVLQLGRRVNFEEEHARTVARLALELFDTAQQNGLHDLNSADRELLRYAALLHDSGAFIAYPNHQAHTYYLVHNAGLLGFDEAEIELIAATTLFHRRNGPSEKYREFAALSKADQDRVRFLSMLLRLAESLDRSHAGLVQHASLKSIGKKRACLEVTSDRDCSLELWAVNTQLDHFRKVFRRQLELKREG
jgi:exopolyphosphatase/guanosine-5'-triphosphate,3'-diphosphate pyrophosphatase